MIYLLLSCESKIIVKTKDILSEAQLHHMPAIASNKEVKESGIQAILQPLFHPLTAEIGIQTESEIVKELEELFYDSSDEEYDWSDDEDWEEGEVEYIFRDENGKRYLDIKDIPNSVFFKGEGAVPWMRKENGKIFFYSHDGRALEIKEQL